MIYEIETTEIALAKYLVTASSKEEAQAKLEKGEYDMFVDLGHEDMQIHEVREVA